jgi:DNA-binding IclR family transcriptional regulator
MSQTRRTGDVHKQAGAVAPASTMRSLERAFDVIESLVAADGPQRLIDIARATGLTSATALRILSVLEKREFVVSHDQRYRLGVGNLVTAYGFMRDSALSRHAKPYMQELAAATGLSVALYVRYGAHRVQIVRINGKDPLRYELPNGRLLPLHLGSGKVFAAHTTREGFDQLTAELPEVMRTIQGHRFTAEDLWDEVQQIRERGYHLSNSERAVGTVSLSAPVTDQQGGLIAVLALLSPTESPQRLDDPALISEIRRAAGAIARIP